MSKGSRGSKVKVADANRLNKLIRKAGCVLRVELRILENVSKEGLSFCVYWTLSFL